MKTKSLILAVLSLVCLVQIAATASVGQIQRNNSRGSNLYKRSLCNTFGGCGAKRSLTNNGMDEFVEARFPQAKETSIKVAPVSTSRDYGNTINEILEEFYRQLKRERNYLGRHGNKPSAMVQPKQTTQSDEQDQTLAGDRVLPQSEGGDEPIQDIQEAFAEVLQRRLDLIK